MKINEKPAATLNNNNENSYDYNNMKLYYNSKIKTKEGIYQKKLHWIVYLKKSVCDYVYYCWKS